MRSAILCDQTDATTDPHLYRWHDNDNGGSFTVVQSSLAIEKMSIMDGVGDKRKDIKAWKNNWKEKLRQICLQRVRQDRTQLLWDFRLAGSRASANTIKDDFLGSPFGNIVADELEKAKGQSVVVRSLELQGGRDVDMEGKDVNDKLWEQEALDAPSDLGDEEYEALMLAMEHALYEDIHLQLEVRDDQNCSQSPAEAAIAEEYETVHAIEDESLAAAVEHWQEHEDGLLCPLCRTRRLQQSPQSIFCGCGRFRIDTRSEQVGLGYLQTRLAEVLQEHIDSGCRGQGTFSIERRFGIGALYMQCSDCDFFQLVLWVHYTVLHARKDGLTQNIHVCKL